MKKYLFILIFGIFCMTNCTTSKIYVQRSPVAVTDKDTLNVWFLSSETGSFMYAVWMSGAYGDKTKVYLVNSKEFQELVSKSRKQFDASLPSKNGGLTNRF